MNFSRQSLCLPSFKPFPAGLNVTSRWPDTSDFHSPISALVPRPKFMTPSWSTPEPAIRSSDTGQRISCFDSCQLITTLMSNGCVHYQFSCALNLARKYEIEHRLRASKTTGQRTASK